MVFLFVALTIGSLFVEQKMVAAINDWLNEHGPKMKKLPIIGRWSAWDNSFTKAGLSFQNWHAESHAPNLIISLVLSVVLAMLFPAAGLIVLCAGVFSTFLSRPFAEILRFCRGIQAWFARNKDDIKAGWERNKEPLADLFKAIMALIRTITWPWRKYHQGKEKVIQFKTRSSDWVQSHRRAA